MDGEVLSCVMERPRRSIKFYRAIVEGWRPIYAPGANYPILVAGKACQTKGVLLPGVKPFEKLRLKRFEGHEYVIGQTVAAVECLGDVSSCIFLPRSRYIPHIRDPWDFDVWKRRHRRHMVAQLSSMTLNH